MTATRESLETMLMERVPDHAKKFHLQLASGYKGAMDTAKAITARKLEMITAGDDGDDAGE